MFQLYQVKVIDSESGKILEQMLLSHSDAQEIKRRVLAARFDVPFVEQEAVALYFIGDEERFIVGDKTMCFVPFKHPVKGYPYDNT